jgi:hypothetical protein
MSIKEQLHQKIETMSPENLEWLNKILESHEYPDVRIKRSPEKIEAMIKAAQELGEPSETDMTEFDQAMQRRSWSAK